MSAESQILIKNPGINTSPDQNFTSTRARTEISDGVDRVRHRFPDFKKADGGFVQVVELAAGNGPYANRLIKEGLPGEHVVCVDCFEPKEDARLTYANEANWVYLDLVELSDAIQSGRELPQEIEALRENFDVVIMTYPFGLQQGGHAKRLADFFARDENSVRHLLV